MNWITAILAGLIGVLIGGVINVLSDDLPQRRRPQSPRYPDGAPRPPAAWLGVLAFLSGRRQSPAGAALSWRHPLVEVGLGVLYALLALARPLDGLLAFQLLFLAILTLITVIDLEHRLILFVVILPACILALLKGMLIPFPLPDVREALIGGAVGFGTFFVMFLGGLFFSALVAHFRGYELPEVAFGFGDVMLGTFSGMLLGWQAFVFALMLTVFLGAAGALLYLLSKALLRGSYTVFTALPYGPYITLSTAVMLLWRDEVREFVWRLW